jgi:hypothetical protein
MPMAGWCANARANDCKPERFLICHKIVKCIHTALIHRVQFQLEKYGEYVLEMRVNDRVLVSTALLVGRLQPKPAG